MLHPHRIASDAEAIDVAADLAVRFSEEAGQRDRERRLPFAEIGLLKESGLLGVTVPHELGGPDVSTVTLAEIFRLLAEADPSIGQVPHSHFVFLEAVRLQGTHQQRARFFGEAQAGRLFANAQSERNSRTIAEDQTTLGAVGDGYVLEGEKFYATGSLFADWLVVRATNSDSPADARTKSLAFLPAETAGVDIVDDWDGLGQRTTGSGTVRLRAVKVSADQVMPYTAIFGEPTVYGSRAQLLHAALDAGIARAALEEVVLQTQRARPWFESGVDQAIDDPLLIQQAGELEILIRSAEALIAEAGLAIDTARAKPDDDNTAQASVATAAAKVVAARAAVDVSAALFEFGGSRSAAAGLNLDRHWRDGRTHTLHDPTRWKVHHLGRWTLHGTPPPRHGLL